MTNEDGYPEKTIYYNLEGDISGKIFDTNENGVFEKYVLIFENQDSLVLRDIDENGSYEFDALRAFQD